MTEKRLLIDATHKEETRVVIADENRIHELDISATSKTQNKGNIYLAKITRVEPSLQAAFVEYGGDRQGFLPFSEIHPDYYQIPVADRKKLLEEAAAEEAQADEDEEQQEQSSSSRGNRSLRGRRGRRRGGRPRDDNAAQNDNGQKENDESSAETGSEDASASDADNGSAPVAEADNSAENAPAAPQADMPETAAGDDKKSTADSATASPATPPAYLEAPISDSPAVKSDVIDHLMEDAHDTKAADKNADGNESDSSAENADSAPAASNGESDGNGDSSPSQDDGDETYASSEDKAEVESLGDDDEFTRRRKASFLRHYKIQEVIKRNQVMLVQVIKEERGNKGASLSTYISLAGRYCVLMPNSPKTGGISRKISSSEDRKRLKAISEEIRSSNGMSAIIRTAGIDRTRAEIKRDYDYLIKLWTQIRELTLSSTAPALVHEEADIVKRSLRDLYSNDIKEVVIAGEEAFKRARDFMKLMMPSHTARIKHYVDTNPIFYTYEVEDQLLRMHEPQVKLESGGSIVLNSTEALVAIDVNSGRSTSERNVEETALKTNLEAAQEIARQVRLRDLAGLIVIDFIDMFDYKNRRAVERQLKEALKSDRAKIQLGRISAFGLLEMSRQRLRPSFTETNTFNCPHCEGRGFILNPAVQGVQILRFLEKEASAGEYAHLKLKVPSAVALYLLNHKRETLMEMEKAHDLRITVEIGEGLHSASSFMLERYTAEGQKTEVNGMEGIPAAGKRNRTRKRKRNDRNSDSASSNHADSSDSNGEESGDASADSSTEGNKGQDGPREEREGSRRRRRGGRRRGGRNREDRSAQDQNGDNATQGDAADNAVNGQQPETAAEQKTEAPKAETVTTETAKTETEKKPARSRSRKPAADKAEADSTEAPKKPAEKAAPKAPAKETAKEPAKAAEPAAAKAPAAKPKAKKELVTEGIDNDNADQGKDSRKGWWRRIVE